ncbi:MAG: hypothetical protein JSR46_00105 [Verrucomicrobia bacterium]|nr:hypothetical protein [Verrucomicrobiota bacterium]
MSSQQQGGDQKSHSEHHLNVKRIEKISKKKGVFFSHVSNFFTWLGELITEEAKSEAQQADPPITLKKSHVIALTQHHPEEVKKRAQSICEKLNEFKKQLTVKFEGNTGSFVGKSVDTMISKARNIVENLHTRDVESGEFRDFLAQAVVEVDLYSQLNTESKIKKKIIQEAMDFIKQSIEKDIAVLTNYKLHSVTDLQISSEEKTVHCSKLDQFLAPVISELKGICEYQFHSTDLEAFFNWKVNVDERRGALVELGLLTIDALTSPFRVQEVVVIDLESGISELLEAEAAAMETQVEDYSLSLSVLASLEDRVTTCFELLQQISSEDMESLKLLQQLFSDLKVESAGLADFEAESPSIQKGFQSLQESIQKADDLLQAKMNPNSFL